MIDTTMMTKIMRSSIDNRGRSKKIEGVASNIGQKFIRTEGSVVTIVHNLDTNLATDDRIKDCGPEIAIYHITIQSKEVEHDQSGSLQENSDLVSSLGSGDLGFDSFFDSLEERSIPRVERLIVSYFSYAVFFRGTSFGHCQWMIRFPH